MVHGGTNFGFENGALWEHRTMAFTTNYDYGAPIDESGRTTDLYLTLRDTISKFVPNNSIPKPPPNVPRMTVPEFKLSKTIALFDTLGNATPKPSPAPMEPLGQTYGFILYEHTATANSKGIVQPGDRPRDGVHVYVNPTIQGIIDSQYEHALEISVTLAPGDKLQLLVENLGRADYYADYLRQPHKGIVGDVVVGDTTLSGCDIYPIPLEQLPSSSSASHKQSSPKTQTPLFYYGSFSVPSNINSKDLAAMDAYLAVPNGVKGQVFVNGFNLGRYWLVGPQQSLYLPGTILHGDSPNEVIVLELEPALVNGTMTAVGLRERKWFNNPDPDCLRCS